MAYAISLDVTYESETTCQVYSIVPTFCFKPNPPPPSGPAHEARFGDFAQLLLDALPVNEQADPCLPTELSGHIRSSRKEHASNGTRKRKTKKAVKHYEEKEREDEPPRGEKRKQSEIRLDDTPAHWSHPAWEEYFLGDYHRDREARARGINTAAGEEYAVDPEETMPNIIAMKRGEIPWR